MGALDMVNFGGVETVPSQFAARQLHVHNAQVTLMRTTSDELRQIARFMCAKLNAARGPLTLLLPEVRVRVRVRLRLRLRVRVRVRVRVSVRVRDTSSSIDVYSP